jgi:hypothetical protein
MLFLSAWNVTRRSRRGGGQRAGSYPALPIRRPMLGAFAGLGKNIG